MPPCCCPADAPFLISLHYTYTAAHVLDQRTFNSPWWAWSTGWVLLVLILVCYPFAMCRGFVMKSKVGKTLSSFRSHWVTHHILILVFTPLLIVHSIPALPKGDVEGHSLTSSKAWLFLGKRDRHLVVLGAQHMW